MKFYTLDYIPIKTGMFFNPSNFTGIMEYKGTKSYSLNNELHRLDGPAREYSDGTKEWWIKGKQYSKEQHKLFIDIMKLKGIKC